MRGFIILAALVVVINANVLRDTKTINPPNCGERPHRRDISKIVNGQEAVNGDWGWQVALLSFGYFSCGASLINSQWVLTAAHCFELIRGFTDPSYYSVQIGVHNRVDQENGSLTVDIEKIIVHPDYSSRLKKSDVALMKLKNPVSYSDRIVPVCLDDGSHDYTDEISWATGWGTLSSGGEVSNVKMEVDMKVISSAKCSDKYSNYDEKVEICAGDKENKDTCQGDSGGPLVVFNSRNNKWTSLGVTSWGLGCGNGGVYARTSAFVSWIQKSVQNN